MRWLHGLVGSVGIGALVAVGALLAALVAAGCQSDSETPNASFGMDGGGAGEIGQPCRNNSRCNDAVAVCIDEDVNDAAPPYCRAGCTTTATNDPCGAGLLCVPIQNAGDSGACLAAPGLVVISSYQTKGEGDWDMAAAPAGGG